MFPTAAVIILLILGLLLRGVVAPWYLPASVVLGFGATLGASVLVFQGLGGQTGLPRAGGCGRRMAGRGSLPGCGVLFRSGRHLRDISSPGLFVPVG